MTTEVKVFLAGTALALLTAAAVFAIVYPAIHRLLGLSATLRAARSFYGRTFFLAIFLAAWSPILSHGVPSGQSAPAPASSATSPAAPAARSTAPAPATPVLPPAPAVSKSPPPAATDASAKSVTPAAPPRSFMEAVWEEAKAYKDVCWYVSLYLAFYVFVLTIVYAVLGRHRDAEEKNAARA